jgi:hypothetical protein
MFSYNRYNPNGIPIISDSHVIPFGHRCSSALVCKYANLRKFSLPFDWTIPTFPGKIQRILENDFQDFIPDVRNHVVRGSEQMSLKINMELYYLILTPILKKVSTNIIVVSNGSIPS